MYKAKMKMLPNGRFEVWCDSCDSSGEFPDELMALEARAVHWCGEIAPPYSWAGWRYDVS